MLHCTITSLYLDEHLKAYNSVNVLTEEHCNFKTTKQPARLFHFMQSGGNYIKATSMQWQYKPYIKEF